VSPSLVRRWKHLMQEGGQTAVAMENEILRAAQEEAPLP
jgi:transposase-like protein